MDFKHFCEKKAMLGYGSALLYRDPTRTGVLGQLYSILMPLESTPVVSGSNDTYELDILTCPSKSVLKGKRSLDAADQDFLWHRDNTDLLYSLKDKVLDFIVVYQDFTAWGFSGTIDFRPNESEAEYQRGTLTLTPLSETGYISDCRDMIMDTAWITTEIPSVVTLEAIESNGTITGYKAFEIDIMTNPSYTECKFEANGTSDAFTVTITQPVAASGNASAKPAHLKIEAAKVGSAYVTPSYDVVTITVKDAKDGEAGQTITYAPHTTTIAVEY